MISDCCFRDNYNIMKLIEISLILLSKTYGPKYLQNMPVEQNVSNSGGNNLYLTNCFVALVTAIDHYAALQ